MNIDLNGLLFFQGEKSRLFLLCTIRFGKRGDGVVQFQGPGPKDPTVFHIINFILILIIGLAICIKYGHWLLWLFFGGMAVAAEHGLWKKLTSKIRRRTLFAALALGSLVLLFGLFGRIMYSAKGSDAAYLNRGVTHLKKRQYEQAISNYNKALEINPRYAEAYNNRGKVYGIKGRYEKAFSDFNKAIEIDPGPIDPHINTYYWRGCTWKMKGDHGRAIAHLNKALEIHPRHANACNVLA